jgi:hypothetical protein
MGFALSANVDTKFILVCPIVRRQKTRKNKADFIYTVQFEAVSQIRNLIQYISAFI